MHQRPLIHLILLSSILSSPLLQAQATSFTKEVNQNVLKELPFDNTEDFKDASRGFIAPLPNDGIIKNGKGKIVWEYNRVVTNHSKKFTPEVSRFS